MSDGVDGALDVRGAALESASATLADPGEQELAGRLRSLLAHPAIWADVPGAAAPPRPADLPDEIATPPRPAKPSAGRDRACRRHPALTGRQTPCRPGPPITGQQEPH
jgi:hypothetical protein